MKWDESVIIRILNDMTWVANNLNFWWNEMRSVVNNPILGEMRSAEKLISQILDEMWWVADNLSFGWDVMRWVADNSHFEWYELSS